MVYAPLALVRKELAAFFHSLIAYVVLAVFLVGVGLFFWVFPGNVLESGLAQMDALFQYGPWFFLLLVPAVTMRALAEEFRAGTYELLATRPLGLWRIVIGKYVAALVLVALALVPTLLYMLVLGALGNPPWSLDTGAIWGAYLGLLLVAAVFVALGLFCSACTDNQVVAFVAAAFACFILFYGPELLAELPWLAAVNETVLALGLSDHYQSISRGVVDTRDLLYFLSLTALLLLATHAMLQYRTRA